MNQLDYQKQIIREEYVLPELLKNTKKENVPYVKLPIQNKEEKFINKGSSC